MMRRREEEVEQDEEEVEVEQDEEDEAEEDVEQLRQQSLISKNKRALSSLWASIYLHFGLRNISPKKRF